MIKKITFILALSIGFSTVYAQSELNASVRVSTPQLQRNDRKVFDQLEVSLKDFLNNTKWTNENFEQVERIKCNFILTISKELDGNVFEAELAVQATRPVFGSGYDTPLLSHLDKDVLFTYEQNQPIEFLRDNPDNRIFHRSWHFMSISFWPWIMTPFHSMVGSLICLRQKK
ncbi:MAG: DUF4835 family protein [Lewinellaceae bacterium]|nr:DUF4835 family protein [Lewinellaceae bacterium]